MHVFVLDHERYPWRVPIALGGSQTRDRVRYSFQALANEINALKVLTCPSGTNRVAQEWKALADTNISYFVGIDSREARPGMLLVGDQNLEGGRTGQNCPVAQVNGWAIGLGRNEIPSVYWSAKQHRRVGNISVGDASAHQVDAKATKNFLSSSDDDPNAFNNHILKPRP
jgi:hypothetical protein